MSLNGSTEHSEDLDYRLEDDVPEQPSGGGATSKLLVLAGFGMTATGLGLAFAPEYSWTVTKFAQKIAANGVDFGALIAGGFVLVGLGLATRRFRPVAFAVPASAPAPAEDSNDSFLVEQLAEDVAHVRNAVSELAQSLSALSDEQSTFREERREQTGDSPETPMGQQQNALFRLAASLDQLGARFDERMEAHIQTLSGRFDGFEGVLQVIQSEMSSMQQVVSRLQSTPAPAVVSAPEPEARFTVDAVEAIVPASEDDTQVVVDLESGTYEDGPVLDFFEDSEEPSEEVADPYARNPYEQDPPPALPSQDAGFGAGLGGSSQPPSTWESSLEKLLPDDHVRRAIDKDRDE